MLAVTSSRKNTKSLIASVRPSHLPRVALAVEVDKAAHPVQERVLRAQAMVLQAQTVPDLIEQLWLSSRRAPINKVHKLDERNGAYSG